MSQGDVTGGDIFGHFTLRRKLGAGGMGEVWLAHDQKLDRDVAIKVLRAAAGPDDVRRVANLLREAQQTARLNHPNVVTVHEVGEIDARVFIAMEYVAGGNLADELRQRGALPWREATQAVRDAAAGLEGAHDSGLIHRDIKPSNLMRSNRGLVKIVDFGLARADSGDVEATQTQPGTLLGSPAYMSPEQCRGERVDHRCDLYSLTCTYYELLAGKLPFTSSGWAAAVYQHCHEPFPNASLTVAGLPPAVRCILSKGSQKKPEDRYQSATEMLADLEAALSRSDETDKTGFVTLEVRNSSTTLGNPVTRGHGVWPKLALIAFIAIAGAVIAMRIHRPQSDAGKSAAIAGAIQSNPRIVPAAVPLATFPATRNLVVATTSTIPSYVLPDEPGLFRVLDRVGLTGTTIFQFFPDSRRLMATQSGKTVIWDLETDDIKEFDVGTRLSADGRWLWFDNKFVNTQTWTSVTESDELSFDKAVVLDHRYVLFRGYFIGLLDLKTGGRDYLPPDLKRALAYSDDARYILGLSDDNVPRIFRVGTGEEVAKLDGYHFRVGVYPSISADGQLAFLFTEDANRREGWLWQWKSGKKSILVENVPGSAFAQFSPVVGRVLTGRDEKPRILTLWDISDASAPRKVWERDPGSYMSALALSADGRRILTTRNQKDLSLLDAETGDEVCRLRDREHEDRPSIGWLVFSPDGRLAMSAGLVGTISIWRLPDPVAGRPATAPAVRSN